MRRKKFEIVGEWTEQQGFRDDIKLMKDAEGEARDRYGVRCINDLPTNVRKSFGGRLSAIRTRWKKNHAKTLVARGVRHTFEVKLNPYSAVDLIRWLNEQPLAGECLIDWETHFANWAVTRVSTLNWRLKLDVDPAELDHRVGKLFLTNDQDALLYKMTWC